MDNNSCRILNLKGEAVDKVELPTVFKTVVRPDIIKRGVLSIQSHRFQPQGRNAFAGKRTTAESRGVGFGMSRIARVKGQGLRAMLAPGTVGGRQAHPPVVEKKIVKRIPRKEMQFAMRSAIAATASKKIVTERGHITEGIPNFPLVVLNDIQNLKKTNEVKDSFIQFGVWPDVERVTKSRKVRAGRGKMRGRKMKQAIGPLLVVTENFGIVQAARNIPGVDVVKLKNLNVELLAPGTHPGRLTVWTSSTIENLDEFFRRGYQ